ncbi:MAG TPA: fatty acid desaturase [Candidatus Tectomicrobia bacterium]|nr:fatty acid desaturase [Candidatus Tectomicrobia bacterium]
MSEGSALPALAWLAGVASEAWPVVLVAVALTQAAVFATSIYLHRALAHRALVMRPVTDMVFRTALWLTTGQRRRQWVAVHRKHHAFTDRRGDPHSPRLLGYWRVQLLNVWLYVRAARDAATLATFASDVREDWLDRHVFDRGWLGVAIGTVALVPALGLVGAVAAMVLHALLYVFVLAPLINALGHWRGAQNFPNTAYNSRLLAWVTGGESLHNNHHARPRAAKFSVRGWEFDPCWPVIRTLAAVRLIILIGTTSRLS